MTRRDSQCWVADSNTVTQQASKQHQKRSKVEGLINIIPGGDEHKQNKVNVAKFR